MSQITFNEYLEKKDIDLLNIIQNESPDAIQEMLVLLNNEGELTSEEIETFSYVFDVIEEEFKGIDRSLPMKMQEQNFKDLFNKNKMDIFVKTYSKVMSTSSAIFISLASANALGAAMSNFALAVPAILSISAGLTKYPEYTKNKKYGEESIVRDWLKIKTDIEGNDSSSSYHKRINSFNKKMAYFKTTARSRVNQISEEEERKTIIGNVKKGLQYVSSRTIDFLLHEFGDDDFKMNDKIREAEKMIYKTWGSTDEIEEVFKEVNMKIYNEHLSRNMEEYAAYLAKERFLLHQEIKQQEQKISDGDFTNPRNLGREVVELKCKFAENTRQLEKIRNLEGINRTKNPYESIYYAGVSRIVDELLTNDKTLSETYNSRERSATETFLSFSGSRYEELLLLEKKKSLLRIKKEKLERELDIEINKDLNQKDVVIYSKILSGIISKDNPEEAKERMLELLKAHKKEGTKEFYLQETRYNDFIDDFFCSFSTYAKAQETDPDKIEKNFRDKIREVIIRRTGKDPYEEKQRANNKP